MLSQKAAHSLAEQELAFSWGRANSDPDRSSCSCTACPPRIWARVSCPAQAAFSWISEEITGAGLAEPAARDTEGARSAASRTRTRRILGVDIGFLLGFKVG